MASAIFGEQVVPLRHLARPQGHTGPTIRAKASVAMYGWYVLALICIHV